jgi:hypothetical protein
MILSFPANAVNPTIPGRGEEKGQTQSSNKTSVNKFAYIVAADMRCSACF